MPPVLIASLPDETPGPSAAVGSQQEEEVEEEEDPSKPQKRRAKMDELLNLLKEEIAL